MKKCFLLLLASVLALGLAACGGGSGGGSADETEIEATITRDATSSSPTVCTKFSTEAFVEQKTGLTGKKAMVACEESAKNRSGAPDAVDVSEVEVDGSKATADVKFSGGSLDGQTTTVALVDEGGQWKLDEITGFADLDKEAVARSFEKAVKAAGLKPGSSALSCVSDKVRAAEEDELETVLLQRPTSSPLLNELKGCLLAEIKKATSEGAAVKPTP